ncbi:MAG: S8 family peptidase [Sphaerochaeta sp.]|nr:S8 family peptidase [Sphaerochaeta sp.]
MIYKLKNIGAAQIEDLRNTPEFGLVEELVPMPSFSIELDSFRSTQPVPSIHRDPDVHYAKLGVLDTGIAELESFKPWMVERRFSQYILDSLDFGHGTQVASVALFGDLLEGTDWVGSDGFELVDCAVIPNGHNTQIDEDELILNIKEAVTMFSDVQIWNMSFSLMDTFCPDAYSDFAKVLDELQTKNDILICKSCGNDFKFEKDKHKPITQGSESVMCITVGSVAHKQRDGDYSMIGHPSPFTRKGPGPNFLIKPDVSHYGGNARIDPQSQTVIPTGVSVISKNGAIESTVGSSVSTPRVSGLACRLTQSMDLSFEPLLIKALIIHSAQYPASLKLSDPDRVNLCGYGIPSSIQDILHDSPDEITLIIRAALVNGKKVEILDFPMPECLIENGFYRGQITATLVHKPLIDPSQGLEFCQSEIELQFGSYSYKQQRDMGKSNVLNPIGRLGSKNVFTDSVISRRAMQYSHHFATERALVYRGKYHPVKKYVADFDTFTAVSKQRYLGQKRSWYLHLQGLYRDQITRKYRDMEKELPPLEYCLVLTIKDPSEKNRLNDEAIQKLDYYNFWHQSLQLSSEIQISV